MSRLSDLDLIFDCKHTDVGGDRMECRCYGFYSDRIFFPNCGRSDLRICPALPSWFGFKLPCSGRCDCTETGRSLIIAYFDKAAHGLREIERLLVPFGVHPSGCQERGTR